ncbi:MAG: arginine--tRNA ligase [Alphaproteobacteria bacterium]|nr:MAG: arginine--tRNA ligase [Alphaproteobacteria bacterium]
MKAILDFIINQIKKYYQPSDKELERITLEPCKFKQHGDVTTNAFMILKSKLLDTEIQTIQDDIEKTFPIQNIEKVGPGFLNIKFHKSFWQNKLLEDIAPENIGQNQKILLEFLSANPTGPLHIGHARNAVLGDTLARILTTSGFDITKEYYINDAGNQIDMLGRSLELRYKEQHGYKIKDDDFTEDMYIGEYLKDAAQTIDETPRDFKSCAVGKMMDMIQSNLKKLNIEFDVLTSERKLVEDGAVDKAFETLKKSGDVKEGMLEKPKDFQGEWNPRKQWIFESKNYGDDQNRAMKKADGTWTYFASDVAYHYDKYQRGFEKMINIFGADHIGYIKRLKAAVKALSNGKADLNILVCQLVNFMKNGEPLKMSKRKNTFVTMAEVIDEIGADALRFLLLMRNANMSYDFDLEKAVEQTKDNPIFYVQYATARIGSLMRRYKGEYDKDTVALLEDEDEISLIQVLQDFPRALRLACVHYEPHRLANYAYQLASDFHSLWSKKDYRFIVEDNAPLSSARMYLARYVLNVLTQTLDILGVSAPLEM